LLDLSRFDLDRLRVARMKISRSFLLHAHHPLSDLARSYSSSLFARSCSLLRPSPTLICCARVMALDSKAHFEQRLTELELRLASALCRKRLDHCWSFRFLDNFRSGQCGRCRVQAPIARAACTPAQVEGPQAPSIRRLFYESYTMAVADLKRKVEANGDELPRRLPTAERAARLVNQQTRLLVPVLEEDLESSNALIDKGIQMVEDNMLSYTSLEQCTTRAQELDNTKAIEEYKTDGGGFLREVSAGAESAANTSLTCACEWRYSAGGFCSTSANSCPTPTKRKLLRFFSWLHVSSVTRCSSAPGWIAAARQTCPGCAGFCRSQHALAAACWSRRSTCEANRCSRPCVESKGWPRLRRRGL
jgi:hypothetical protein